MKRIALSLVAAAAAGLAACHDGGAPTASNPQLPITLQSAFASALPGTVSLNTSFVGSENDGPFMPEFGSFGMGGGHDHGFGFGPPGDGPGFGLGLMGGGLFGGFDGDGIGHELFPNDTSCHYASSTGLVTCGPTTHNGLTVKSVLHFQTASGASQAKADSTTNTVTSQVTVSGTETRRDSTTSTINSSSNETVTGLAVGSTQRTVNSSSASNESGTGKSPQGSFTDKRVAGDTVKGVVVPAATSSNRFPYPTAGTVIRSMTATVTFTGQSPTTSTRREVITYDGSSTAKVVITHDGTTQNCTLPLPHGHLTCS